MILESYKHRVIRVYVRSGPGTYEWQYYQKSVYGNMSFHTQLDHDAYLDEFTKTEIINIIIAVEQYLSRDPKQRWEYLELEYKTCMTELSIDEDELKEAKRRVALEKLTDEEIELLDLGRFATYNKLKFHNTEDEDADDNDYTR